MTSRVILSLGPESRKQRLDTRLIMESHETSMRLHENKHILSMGQFWT